MKYNLYVDGVGVEAVFDKLGGVAGAKRFLAGNVEVVIKDHIVGGGNPFVPEGWEVVEHRALGDLKLTRESDNLFLGGKKIGFHLSPNQQGDKSIKGDKLRKELTKMPVLNANVLDYLLAHPDLIPDSWKVDSEGRTRYLFFWGTIYRLSDGDLYVRSLYWRDGKWYWGGHWLGHDWRVSFPAAVLAS